MAEKRIVAPPPSVPSYLSNATVLNKAANEVKTGLSVLDSNMGYTSAVKELSRYSSATASTYKEAISSGNPYKMTAAILDPGGVISSGLGIGPDKKAAAKGKAAAGALAGGMQGGSYQYDSFEDYIKAMSKENTYAVSKLRTKDLRRLRGWFEKERAAEAERMARFGERMQGMQATQAGVQSRAMG